MTSGFIRRDLIPWHEETFEERCHNDVWSTTAKIAFKSEVDNIPSADAETVRHARWEFDADPYMFCSFCGGSVGADSAFEFNYCPNCGAKMDLEEPT